SHITSLDPFLGGATAVDEVCRNLVAVGARPHSLANCLNFGNPEKPDRLWAFREAVRGLGTTAKALGLPIPSGNVSFYNESSLGPCPPTPVVLGVGIVEDLRVCVTSDFKVAGDPVVLVGTTAAGLGGAERTDRYAEFAHLMEGTPPTFLGTTGGTSLHLAKGRQWTSLALSVMRKAWGETIPRQVVVT